MLAWRTPRWPGLPTRSHGWAPAGVAAESTASAATRGAPARELGREGIEHIVAASVAAIRARTAGDRQGKPLN